MGRYFASKGIKDQQKNPQDWPALIIWSPSGSAVVVGSPSGSPDVNSIPRFDSGLYAYADTYNHACLAWQKNEIVAPFRTYDIGGAISDVAINRLMTFVWQPYGQTEGLKQNTDNVFQEEPGLAQDLRNLIMFDGVQWKNGLTYTRTDEQHHIAMIRIPGGAIHWMLPTGEGDSGLQQGLYKGEDPEYVDSTTPGVTGSGWSFRGGRLGNSNDSRGSWAQCGVASRFSGPNLAGIRYNRSLFFGTNDNPCDMIYYKGTTYYCNQHAVYASVPGGQGNILMYDIGLNEEILDSNFVDDVDLISRDTSLNFGGSLSRSFAIHNDVLYMLGSDGKVWELLGAGIRLRADLSNLGTPWASGIVGGDLDRSSAAGGGWDGQPFYRCKLFSFNQQLHAMLNFNTDFRIAKPNQSTIGRGIFWATSYDGTNWTDFSPNLPSSGILTPSGRGAQTSWFSLTNPYIFSARVGADALFYPSGYVNPSGRIGGPRVIGEDNFPAQPSGFRQQWPITEWSSGIIVDPPNTPYQNLQVPLEFGAQSGFLFPTFIAYPGGWGFQYSGGGPPSGLGFPLGSPSGDIFAPSGTGPSGYDYTGVNSYHISATVDEDEELAHLIFSEDFEEANTLYYTLNRASGWVLKNELRDAHQLNGLISIDLYDPEVIIPSGGLIRPNPYVDTVAKTVTVDYQVYDWPFWDSVDITWEYTTDRQTWNKIGTSKNISTGTKQSDPSGVIGNTGQFTWNYDRDLSPNAPIPYVQIRGRAKSNG